MKFIIRLQVIFILFSCLTINNNLKGQDLVATSDFDLDSLETYMLRSINSYRSELQLDTLFQQDFFTKCALMRASNMSEAEKAEINKNELIKISKSLKGTKNVDEVILAYSIKKGKTQYSVKFVVDEIMNKWKNSKKDVPILTNPTFLYFGAKGKLDEEMKKVYVSVVFGSYNSFNDGSKKRKELPVAFTKKNKKLKPADAKACKNCDKFRDYVGLREGLYVKDGKIFLKYENLKALKKLLKKPSDGFAIDIIQLEQYKKPEYNIVDNNLQSKGILLKKVGTSSFFKRNEAKPNDKKKVTTYDGYLGKVPSKLKGEYELNLLVIQDNKLCKTLRKSYIEQGDQKSNTPLDMLLMPDSVAYLKPKFKPEAENTILNFVVPFEKNKSEYNPEDIKPFLDALQEPDFIVEGLYIYAYSSIEGDSVANAKLQRNRSENIIKAFEKMQSGPMNTNIKTSDSWELFKMEMEDGKYDYLTKMSKRDAIKEINTKGLATELEPVLAKERFAQIVMDITYDIKGPKEQKFVVAQFNKMVRQNDIPMAYKIQHFMNEKVREGKYTNEIIPLMQIPKEPKYSGLLMNQAVFNYWKNDRSISDEDLLSWDYLEKLDQSNKYITYNSTYAFIKEGEFKDQSEFNIYQGKIDNLYTSNIPKRFIDGLNTEYQFKVMEAADTLPEASAIISACMERIKSFYNFKEGSWQNSLKMAYVFMKFHDFKFASSILEPYVKQENPDEQLLFTYISACAQQPDKFNSATFVTAMQKAREKNSVFFCQLLGDPYLTFQVMDNPLIKAEYLKANCQ